MEESLAFLKLSLQRALLFLLELITTKFWSKNVWLSVSHAQQNHFDTLKKKSTKI